VDHRVDRDPVALDQEVGDRVGDVRAAGRGQLVRQVDQDLVGVAGVLALAFRELDAAPQDIAPGQVGGRSFRQPDELLLDVAVRAVVPREVVGFAVLGLGAAEAAALRREPLQRQLVQLLAGTVGGHPERVAVLAVVGSDFNPE
jgi:hypothetical protein